MWYVCFPTDNYYEQHVGPKPLQNFSSWPQKQWPHFYLPSFFRLWSAIHRQGYSPVIIRRRQWLPDTRAPCKRCCHPSISIQCERTHKKNAVHGQHTVGQIRAHKSNLSQNRIPSFCFPDSKVRWGSGIGWNVHRKSNHYFEHFWGHATPSSPNTAPFWREKRFQSLYSCQRSFSKLSRAKSKSIRWVIACYERSNLIFSSASHCVNEHTA